jgi:methionyl-tRNA formyltransferase
LLGSAGEIFLRATKVIEEMIVEIVKKLPEPKSQIGDPVFFKRRKPAEGNLNKAESLDQIFDLIRMLDADGYPRAFIDIGCFRMEFPRSLIKSNEVQADVRIFYKPVNESEKIIND